MYIRLVRIHGGESIGVSGGSESVPFFGMTPSSIPLPALDLKSHLSSGSQ